jgi:hypothetical protein
MKGILKGSGLFLVCPYCQEDHELPELIYDDYGGIFTTPCGRKVDTLYDETYDDIGGEEYPIWWLEKLDATPDDIKNIKMLKETNET